MPQWIFRAVILGMMGLALAACGTEEECDATVDEIIQSDGNENAAFHDNLDREEIAQSFRLSGGITLDSVTFSAKKVGSPGGFLKVSIHEQDGERPEEDVIDGGNALDREISSISGDFFSPVDVRFDSQPELNGDRTYYIVIRSTEPVSGENYLEFAASSDPAAYANGTALHYDGDIEDLDDAWGTDPFDLQFTMKRCESVD